MINWPIVCVLYLSVAHRNFHELASITVLAFMTLWELRSGLIKLIKVIPSLATDHVVNRVFLKNFSVLNVLIHGGLSYRDDSVNQIPKNTFDKWGGGEGSLIGESPVEVDQFDEFAKVERTLFRVFSTCWQVFCLVHVGNHDLFVLLLVN